jgi:tripartite-type tricarboxylate transporter receptor subunit TctC
LSLGFWAGLWAPAGTPRPIVDELNRATNAALSSPQMKDSMARLGIAPSLGTVQDFEAFIADEAPRWAEIVKASGTQID